MRALGPWLLDTTSFPCTLPTMRSQALGLEEHITHHDEQGMDEDGIRVFILRGPLLKALLCLNFSGSWIVAVLRCRH